eukprot:3097510-Heterocapsa_arctica.AAC.1
MAAGGLPAIRNGTRRRDESTVHLRQANNDLPHVIMRDPTRVARLWNGFGRLRDAARGRMVDFNNQT